MLTLKNLDGTAIQTLGYAFNLKAKLCYNEVSEISFDVPAQVDGIPVPGYGSLVGMRIVELAGYGQFILINPAVSADGVREVKSCKGYSLEFEFSYKKLSLENAVYNFWNPAAPDGTVLGIIMERMPSWSVGEVSPSLIGKYRTFELSDANLYNFIKSTLQKTYSCIFEFDTLGRTVHVRDVSDRLETKPVFLSLDNTLRELKLQEDNENIFTCLEVYGVDGDGASLHNAVFNLYNGSNTQITLNPYSGFAIGSYPLYSGDQYTIDQDKAKFYVDTQGNVIFKGELRGATGTFSGDLSAASGTFKGVVQASDFRDNSGKSMMADDKFKSDYLELKGLTIRNSANQVTLTIDSGGNISMRGNLTMTGGSISWANVNTDPAATNAMNRADSAYSYADDAYDLASDANGAVSRLANGRYSGTFINGSTIISPTIQTNLLTITSPNNNASEHGMVLEGYYSNQLYQMLKISYWAGDGAYVNFGSPAGAYANWNFGNSYFFGNLDFNGATVKGLYATFA